MIAFYIFSALLILLSLKSFRGGIDYLRFFRHEFSKPAPASGPFVTVIAPCRGIDSGLRENFYALAAQDYADFEIIFVVDDLNDPAVPVINEILQSSAERTMSAQLILAPRTRRSSQKVENIREAVLHADTRSEILVFVDSDARPAAEWLRYLVAPLGNASVGAATGYRWFISKRGSFASEMRSAWNASIASALGPNTKTNFCWGGSTAIRREVFERLGLRERLEGTLSDDFTITRILSEAGLRIVFVPQALTASVGDCSLRELFEFTTRQMKITRVYAPHLWLVSLFGSAVFSAVMVTAFLIVLFSKPGGVPMVITCLTIALVTLLSTGKSWLRLKAVRLALPDFEADLKRQSLAQYTLWLLAPALFLFNSLAAGLSRRFTWRGIRYELKSATETVIIAD